LKESNKGKEKSKILKKLRVYLDTSVISHLDQQDNPEYMQITKEFWKEVKKGKYEIVVSDIVFAELRRCSEPKRSILLRFLAEIEYNTIEISKEIRELAKEYIKNGIIPLKYIDDAIHIAAATVSQCDALVSWNFKHIVKLKTIQGINGVNKLVGYKEIQLVSPQMMLEEKE